MEDTISLTDFEFHSMNFEYRVNFKVKVKYREQLYQSFYVFYSNVNFIVTIATIYGITGSVN